MDLQALEAQVAAEEAAALTAALSDEEQRKAALLGRLTKAREERAAAARTRRGLDLADRESKARTVVPAGVLVKGIDLYELFPLGEAPPAEHFPGAGVIIVRSPVSDRLKAFQTEAEHKKRPLADIFTDLICDSLVDPDPAKDAGAGAKVRGFFETYAGAAVGAGDIVAKLGGSKAAVDKRGRS